MPKSSDSLGAPSGSGGTAFRMARELARARESNWPAYAYMRFVINGKQSIDRQRQIANLLDMFPGLRRQGPSLFVNDGPDGTVIHKYTTSVRSTWQALSTSSRLPQYNRELLDAKDDNTGHALVLDSDSDLDAKLGAPLEFVYINATGPDRPLHRIISDIIPDRMADGASLVVRVPAPDSGTVLQLVRSTAGNFGEAFVCVPEGGHILDTELFFVFFGSGVHKVEEAVWQAAIDHFQANRTTVRQEALDIFAYLDAIGLDTHEQCRKHYAETTGR